MVGVPVGVPVAVPFAVPFAKPEGVSVFGVCEARPAAPPGKLPFPFVGVDEFLLPRAVVLLEAGGATKA